MLAGHRTTGPRRSGALGLKVALAVLVLVVLIGAVSVAWLTPTRGRPETPKLVLIGIDGGEWRVIEPLIEQGRLPTFARLIEEGASGNLTSYQPTISPQIWTTIVTGKTPDEHGIDWFTVQPDDPSQRVDIEAKAPMMPITSWERKVPSIWDILSQDGQTVGVIGFWATWPATPVNGYMVSDRFSYSRVNKQGSADRDMAHQTHPPELAAELRPFLMAPNEVTPEHRSRFMAGDVGRGDWRTTHDLVGEFDITLAQTETYRSLGLNLLEQAQPDLWAIYFQGVDVISHHFWEFMRPDHAGREVPPEDTERYGATIAAFYEYQDEILADILERLEEDTIVIVASDHGFRDLPLPERSRPGVSGWHRLSGLVAIWGKGVRQDVRLKGVDVYDLMPTMLAIKGLPLARDMGGRVISEAFEAGVLGESSYVAAYTEMPEAPEGKRMDSPMDEAMLDRLESLGYIGGED